MSQTIHVAAAILFADNKILACQRTDVPASVDANQAWEFPGGKVEPGETPEAAVRREVTEELGLTLGTMFYFDSITYNYPDFELQMDCYVARLAPNTSPKLRVHSDCRWLGREELDSVSWLPADISLIASLSQYWDRIFGEEML